MGPGLAMTKGWRLQHLETQRDLHGAASARTPSPKPAVVDRLFLQFSTSRTIDGLWVGTTESRPHPALTRVEAALQLIKHHNPLHYSRVIHRLERIWVHLLPSGAAIYDRSLKACIFDERYVLAETMTLEQIASTIVHEATHAGLEQWGITYDEKRRPRIEAICLRRELNFAAGLPNSGSLREELARTLEWCGGEHDYFSNVSFQQRDQQGKAETLRYLGAPDWLIGFVFKVAAFISALRGWAHRFSRPQRQA
jgi:hypothetical protein